MRIKNCPKCGYRLVSILSLQADPNGHTGEKELKMNDQITIKKLEREIEMLSLVVEEREALLKIAVGSSVESLLTYLVGLLPVIRQFDIRRIYSPEKDRLCKHFTRCADGCPLYRTGLCRNLGGAIIEPNEDSIKNSINNLKAAVVKKEVSSEN